MIGAAMTNPTPEAAAPASINPADAYHAPAISIPPPARLAEPLTIFPAVRSPGSLLVLTLASMNAPPAKFRTPAPAPSQRVDAAMPGSGSNGDGPGSPVMAHLACLPASTLT